MGNRDTCTFSIFLPLVVAVVWLTTVQAGADALRRDLYGADSPEYFAAFLDDRESAGEKAAQMERQPSRLAGEENRRSGSSSKSRYLRDEETGNRLLRNLDHIGGGNLLRRGLAGNEAFYDGRGWLAFRRNLDQIGGGNLLREAEARGERNLDQIGGGNLVRGLDDPLPITEDLRRNLDDGNLVRSLTDAVRELERRPGQSRSREPES